MKIKMYGRKFKTRLGVEKYIKGRIKSWQPILKITTSKRERKHIRGFQRFWKKELKRLK